MVKISVQHKPSVTLVHIHSKDCLKYTTIKGTTFLDDEIKCKVLLKELLDA